MKDNEDIVEFIKFWGPYCDDIEVCGLSNHIGMVDNKDISLSSKWDHRKSCPQIKPFQEIDVLYNGDVVICCVDFLGRCILGNLLEKDFEEIWHSEKMTEIRKKAYADNTHELEPCRDCFTADYSSVFWKNMRLEINLIHDMIKRKEWDTLHNIQWVKDPDTACGSCGAPMKINFVGFCLQCIQKKIKQKQ